MNASQRRKSKRGHPHIITIHTKVQATYREHDEKVYQAVGWCKKNCKGNWKCDTGWDHADFKFSNQKDAIYFALKWA